jgi:hypothetical protein
VTGRQAREQLGADELAESPLEPIPVDRGVLVPWDDDADPSVAHEGRRDEDSHVEVLGADALAALSYGVELRGAGEPAGARERERPARRRRGAERLAGRWRRG